MRQLAFSPANFKLVLVVYAIFVFKDVINASGVIAGMGAVGDNVVVLLLVIIILPFFCGMLTGIMVGYVGACFPIILGILAKSGLEPHLTPLIVLALVAGNVGMMISPLHVCLVVTLNYFKSAYLSIWRNLLASLACQLGFGAAWAAILHFWGAGF